MSEYSAAVMPPSSRELSCRAAIVGLGETDYHLDYKASRIRPPGYEPPTPEGLASTAFERALSDCGLRRGDVDGLSLSFIYGGPSPASMAELMGLKPRWAINNGGLMAGPLPSVCAAIAAGECDTVAMIYSAASRAIGRQYGGQTYTGGGEPTSYYYYHPWGWSSQAAHWAFVWSRYRSEFGAAEADLGAVAVQLRTNALSNPNAVMQAPMTIDDYLASRFIVRPLRLFDICLVNDGAVCLIVRRADMARDMPHAPVQVAGWGESICTADKMSTLVRERLRPQLRDSSAQAFTMSGLSLSDVQHLEAYDASSIHMVCQVEGLGFTPEGQGLEFCKQGGMAPGGRLPVNTGGGMLSGAYMHGWSHVAEITRQLRHEAGPRQVAGVEVSMLSVAQTDQSHPILFRRGG